MDVLEILFLIIVPISIITVLFMVSGRKRGKKDRSLEIYSESLNHMLHGEDDEALKGFKEVVKLDTSNIDAYIKIGILFRKVGNAEGALKVHKGLLYRENLSKNLQIEILRNIVEDYIELKDSKSALIYAQKILEIDKKSDWAVEKVWKLYIDLKQWERAAEFMKSFKGKAVDKRLLAIYKTQEGIQKLEEGLNHESRLYFKRAIKIDPDCEAPYYYIAESYVKDNRREDAVEWWEKFANASPEKAKIVFKQIQDVLFETGNFGKIEQFYEMILSKKPWDVDSINALANYYEKRGESERAESLLSDLLSRNPDANITKLLLSRLLATQGRCNEVVDILNSLIEEDRRDEEHICSNCGHKDKEILWICPECGEVDTFNI